MQPIAQMLDRVNRCNLYTRALAAEMEKVLEPELTLSGRILSMLQDEKLDNGELALKLAAEHKAQLLASPYEIHNDAFFKQQAELSWELQQQMEANDKVDFETFLRQQFD